MLANKVSYKLIKKSMKGTWIYIAS